MSEGLVLSLWGRNQHRTGTVNPKEQGQPQSCVPSFLSTALYPSLTLKPPYSASPPRLLPSAPHASLPEGTDPRSRVTIIRELDHKKIATFNKGPVFVNNLLL